MVLLKIKKNVNLKISNDIALKGKFSLTPSESKFLFGLIALCPKNSHENDSYAIDLNDLVDWMQFSSIQKNRNIKKIISSLKSKTVQILDHEKNQYSPYLWFNEIKLIDNDTILTFTLTEMIYSLSHNLLKDYMSTKAKLIMQFKKTYTTQIYFYCCCWKSLYIPRTISIDEIREKLDIGTKNKSFKDFMKNIINPSIKEINTYTNLVVEVIPNKRRRNYESLTFRITVKENELVEVQFVQDTPEKIAAVERLAKEGVNEDGIMQVKDFSTMRINLNINYVLCRKNVKNKGAYIVNAIINDYACSYLFEENEQHEKIKTDEKIKEKVETIWLNSSSSEQEEAINFIRNNIAPCTVGFLDAKIKEDINTIPKIFTFSLVEFYKNKGAEF